MPGSCSQLFPRVQSHARTKISARLACPDNRSEFASRIACVQNAYSLLDRSSESVLSLCREHDIAWVPYFPLGFAGFPGIASVTEHPAVIAAAATLNATPAQVGLAWLLTHYQHTLLIPGTTSLTHLKENVAAGNVNLDPGMLATLNSAAPLVRAQVARPA